MIENKSPLLPISTPHVVSSKELSPAAKVAEEILSMEKNTDSFKLYNVVSKLSTKENVDDLKCLKLFLTHLNQFEGGRDLIPNLIHNIEINEDGTSNIESMRVPILNMINQDNIRRIQEIAQDPDLFLKWLRFSIVKSRIEIDKIRPDLVQKFLNSNIAKINFIDYTKKVNPDGIGIINAGYSIKYVDSLRVLFNDEELMEAVVDFNLKYPKSSVPLLLWIRNDLSSTKQLLKKAIAEEDKAEILSKIVMLDSLFLLPSINTLFEHPSLSKNELVLLDKFLDHYPANAQVGISMLLFALDHPEFSGKVTQFLSSSNKTKELDFLSNFMNEKKSFSEKTQFFSSFFDLLNIQSELNIDLDEIAWFSEDNFIEVVKHIKELPKEKFDLLKEVINNENVEFFYWAMTVGLLDGYEIDLKEMKRIFDWMVKNPSEYQMIVRICNSIDRDDLFTYGNLGILLWIFIKHFPEDFSTVLNFSQGNVKVALGYINAAMSELKFGELDELKKYQGKKSDGTPNLADFRRIYSQLQNLKDLPIAEKRKINELMYCNHEEIANHIMNLFYNEPDLAKSLLTIATTHNQKKIAEQILEEFKSQPGSLFSRTLKKIALHPKSILEVYNLKGNEEMLESICNDPSFLEKKKNSIQSEFVDKDLKPIFEVLNDFHSKFNERLSDKYQLHSLILNSFISKISKEIIDPDGEINLKAVDQLLETSKTSKLPIGIDYINHITFILNALKNNEDLVDAFSNLTLQENIPPASALMVRATARTAHDTPITTAHLRITALAALLTHERQPPDVGSCVGASRLSYMSKHPVQCMKFISEMLLRGGVSMDLSEKKQVFIRCQPKPSDLFLQTDTLTFTKNEGKAIQRDIYPGIWRLAYYLSIEESQVEAWVQSALDKGVFTNTEIQKDRFLSISHRELIKALMDEIDSSQSVDIAEIVYLSAVENLPARSLEGLFVSSDAVQIANLRRTILAPIKALSRVVSPNKINKKVKIFEIQCENGEESPCAIPKSLQNAWKNEVSKDLLLKELKAQIGNHFDLVYDPSANDFLGNRSCRVLIDATSPFEGRPDPINTKDLFLKLCSKACEKTLANFKGELTDEFKHELISYMGSERFAKAVSLLFSNLSEELDATEDRDKMKSYDPFLENKAFVGQMPWSLKSGSSNTSSWKLVSSKGENSKLYQVNSICREPKDIFYLIENMRGIHNITTPNYQNYAGSMPGHAINFDFSHPQLKEFLQSENLEKWLESNCIAPSKKIAEETFVTEKDYEFLKSKIKEKLPKPLRKKWKDSTVRFFEHPSNIVEVRKFFSDQLKMCLGTEKEAVPEAFNALEEGLIKLIPEESRRKVPMLPIIDTNWVDKDKMHDIYFALYFSPASSKWELWKVDYDEKNIQKASNDNWFSDSNPYYTAFFIA